jgi:hypothetical protein
MLVAVDEGSFIKYVRVPLYILEDENQAPNAEIYALNEDHVKCLLEVP